jgi:L-amino acid N-acyltransferase YncA
MPICESGVENARLEDLPAIVEIYNMSIGGRMATSDENPVTVESRVEWFHQRNPATRPLWVLRSPEKQVIAWVSFQSFYGRPAYACTSEISIYVHDDHQKKGIGKFLLAKAIEQAPSLKIKNLLAFVFSHNQPSVGLFSSAGFQPWGNLPGVALLDEKAWDLLILGLKIP